jgi:hypothetical protein
LLSHYNKIKKIEINIYFNYFIFFISFVLSNLSELFGRTTGVWCWAATVHVQELTQGVGVGVGVGQCPRQSNLTDFKSS